MKLVTTETVHWWMQICKLQSQKWKNKLLIIKGQTQFLPWQMPCQILWHCCPQTRGYCMCVVFSITWPTFSWFTLLPKLFFLSLSVLLFYPSLRWSRAEKGLYCKSGFILTRLKKIILIWIPPSQLLLGWVVGEIPPSAFHLITSVITDVWIQWFFTGLSSGPSSTSLIHWWWLDMTLWCPQVQVPTPELLYGLISERMLFCFQMLHQFWQLTPSRASLHLTAPNTEVRVRHSFTTLFQKGCVSPVYIRTQPYVKSWRVFDSLCITAPPTGKEYE